MVLGALTAAGKFLGAAAPLLSFGAAVSGGGQRRTLQRAASAAGGMGTQQGQATAVDRAGAPPAETAASGEAGGPQIVNVVGSQPMQPAIQPATYVPPTPSRAGIVPAALPAVVGGAVGTVTAGRNIMGMLGLAGGAIAVAPIIIDPFTGEEKKLRVTRKLKSDVRKAVEMFGVEFVAEQMGTGTEVIFYILTKKMRNDGPYVTKAAVRKTRQTVRKMKTLCDMYDDLRPSAKRRAPARRAATTRITQVK